MAILKKIGDRPPFREMVVCPLFSRITETARLMVGVGSYENYRQHMLRHHVDVPAMSETEYFRYCQDSRYPSDKNRAIKRCPC